MKGKRLANLDFSTINIDRLKRLQSCTLPPTYQLQDDCGNGCAGDPPGYPTYFTRSVYTQHGNSPRRGPQLVITFEGKHYVVEHADDWNGVKDWDEMKAKVDKRLQSLWNPLPVDHERTRLWIQGTYSHHWHMYLDREGEYQCKGDTSYTERWNSFVFPVPYYRLGHFYDDPRFSAEWRKTEQEQVNRKNAETVALASKIATPENHCAVVIVRRYYPDHQPIMEWIKGKAPENGGQWWETARERPTPETCPGQYSMEHPCNGSWCQWCGWRTAEKAETEQVAV